MSAESDAQTCVIDIAKRVVEEWTGRDEDVSWENDKKGRAVFSGTCPIDGTQCKVLIDIKNGRIEGIPTIVMGSESCEKNKTQS